MPSKDLMEIIQRIVTDANVLSAIEALNATNAPGAAPRFFPRAWVSFVGATGVIQSSGNVSSVSRAAAGQYTVNFTTAAPISTFAALATSNSATAFMRWTARATGSCGIDARDSAGTLFDPSAITVSFFW